MDPPVGGVASGTPRSQLPGIAAGDTAMWLVAALAVASVALLAMWLPARSAARPQAARLLRGDRPRRLCVE